MKRALLLMLALIMCIAPMAMAQTTETNIQMYLNNPTITVNGEKLTGEAPYLHKGTTLVPLRVISTAFGTSPNWDGKTQKITMEHNGTKLELTIGSTTSLVNGKSVTLPADPQLKNGTTMVPIRFISENFGAEVNYTAANNSIKITGKGSTGGTATTPKPTTPTTPAKPTTPTSPSTPTNKEVSPNGKSLVVIGRDANRAPQDAAIAAELKKLGFRVSRMAEKDMVYDELTKYDVVVFSPTLNEKYVKEGQMAKIAVPQLYLKGIGMTSLGLKDNGKYDQGEKVGSYTAPARVAGFPLNIIEVDKYTEEQWKSIGELAVWLLQK